MSIEAEKVAAFVKGLRKLAALYEKNPDFPIPYLNYQLDVFVDTKEEMAAAAKALAPYKAKKDADSTFFNVSVELDGITLKVNAYRNQVCERKQVGTREVRRQVPVTTREEVVVEPVYEWSCPDSLLASAK
jgi:hypothetical protein